jgi:protein TonB
MARDIDLTSDKWLSLVFEKRNRRYGAYALRNDSSNRHLKAIAIVTLVSLLSIILPKLVKAIAPAEVENVGRDEVVSMVDIKQDIPEEETVRAIEIPPPPELKSTIQFNPPKVVEDEKVTDDNQMLSMDELLESDADISIANIEGSKDGIDIALLTEHKVQIVEEKKEDIPNFVEQMPTFPGGLEELQRWLSKNMTYPEYAETQGIQGTVNLRFVVSEDGSIGNVTVVKSLERSCDEEAVRAVKKMPKWNPGKQNGKAVKVYYNLPVKFKLQTRN